LDLRKTALVRPAVTESYRLILSSERAPHNKLTKLSKENINKKGKKNWSLAPDWGLTPGQTGQLTIGYKINFDFD
jgi:hypothetical protein